MFYWLMKYVIAGPILRGIFRPWVVGLENVPANGAVTFVYKTTIAPD